MHLAHNTLLEGHVTAATARARPSKYQYSLGVDPERFSWVRSVDFKTVRMMVVIKQSLGSWSHMWSLSKVSGCGSTSLFGSCAGTHQGKGSVSRFGR